MSKLSKSWTKFWQNRPKFWTFEQNFQKFSLWIFYYLKMHFWSFSKSSAKNFTK